MTGLGLGEHVTVKRFTVRVSESVAVPPAPVQDSEYVVVKDGVTVTEPEGAPPVEKLVPVQVVAFDDPHVMSASCPDEILVGLATSEAVTAGP